MKDHTPWSQLTYSRNKRRTLSCILNKPGISLEMRRHLQYYKTLPEFGNTNMGI
jgi:hypothetical protein